jgi:hypothetical protein
MLNYQKRAWSCTNQIAGKQLHGTLNTEHSRYSAQLWRLHSHPTMQQQGPELLPNWTLNMCSSFSIVLKLNDMPSTGTRECLLVTFFYQQDAQRHCWDGIVAGTDGSVDERSERMGAGYVLGDQPEPILTFHARVGAATRRSSRYDSSGSCKY